MKQTKDVDFVITIVCKRLLINIRDRETSINLPIATSYLSKHTQDDWKTHYDESFIFYTLHCSIITDENQ